MGKLRSFLFVSLILTGFLTMFSGCAGIQSVSAHYGAIRPSSEVSETFTKYIVKQDHVYYISGSVSHPNAIIAIDKKHILVTKLWKKVLLQPVDHPYLQERKATLKYYADGMEAKVAEFDSVLHGFDIMDNHGNDIGDWYSVLEALTSAQVLGENRVAIPPPPLDLYDRLAGEGEGVRDHLMPVP